MDNDEDDSDNHGGAPSSTLKIPVIIAPTASHNLAGDYTITIALSRYSSA